MLIESKDWPIRVSYKEERRFEGEINAGLKASRLVGDIREDHARKSALIEINDQRVIYLELGVSVAYSQSIILFLSNPQLPHSCTELPAPLIHNSPKVLVKLYVFARSWVVIGLISLKSSNSFLYRLLVIAPRKEESAD